MAKLKIKQWHVFLALLMIVGVFAFSKGALPFSVTSIDLINVEFTDKTVSGLASGQYWKASATLNGIGNQLILREGTESVLSSTEKAITTQDVVIDLLQGEPYSIAKTEQSVTVVQIPYSTDFLGRLEFRNVEAPELRALITYVPILVTITGADNPSPKSIVISPESLPLEVIQTSKGTVGIESLGYLQTGYNPSDTGLGGLILLEDSKLVRHLYKRSDFDSLALQWGSVIHDNCFAHAEFSLTEFYYGASRPSWLDCPTWSSWSGAVNLLKDYSKTNLGNSYNSKVELSSDGIRITHPKFSLRGQIIVWIPRDMADTIIERVAVTKPDITSITLDSNEIDTLGSTILRVSVKNLGSIGEIIVTPSSTSGNLIFTPLSDSRTISKEGTAMYIFTVKSLAVLSDYSDDITAMAWGLGGSDSKVVRLNIRYTPSKEPTKGTTPPPEVPLPTEVQNGITIKENIIVFVGNNHYAGSVTGIGLTSQDMEVSLTSRITSAITQGNIEYILELPFHYKFSLITTDKDADAIGYTMLLKFNVVSASPMKVYKGGELIKENITEFNYLNKVPILGFFVAIGGIALFASGKTKKKKGKKV